MTEERIEFESLVGKHLLSGVDETNRKTERWHGFADCQCINIVLDGKTYTAIEDPDDGYRSQLEGLFLSDEVVSNTFAPVEVIVSHRTRSEGYTSECDILDFVDAKNGKRVLEIGTDNTNDYYPMFVASWTPENLSVNESVPEPVGKGMEYSFTVFIYPLDLALAEELRAELEALILERVVAKGLFMGPLLAEPQPQEGGDVQEG
jgi:hypothetical protein